MSVLWANAIPIPQHRDRPLRTISQSSLGSNNTGTTPSLQSVLDQKRFSRGSLSPSTTLTTSSSTSTDSSSLPSLCSLASSVESCASHPLDTFNAMEDIDDDFFTDIVTLEPIEPLTKSSSPPRKKQVVKKSSFVSSLTNSIKSFTNAAMRQNNELLFDIQPRLTDDKLPANIQTRRTPVIVPHDTELETFKMTSQHASNIPTSTSGNQQQVSVYRNREARINSQFLRLYSHECASRQKGFLPNITAEEEEQYMTDPSSLRGSEREFALIVRQRLWQQVVLPAREDTVQSPEYVYAGADEKEKSQNSLMRNNGEVKPWIKLEDEIQGSSPLKPRGSLPKGVQFTVKGWCNSRWLANQ